MIRRTVIQEKQYMIIFEIWEEGDANFNNIEIPVNEDQNSFKISLIPGHPKLSIIDDTMSKSWSETLSGDKGAIRKLNWLNQLKKENTTFDYILIDVGPSLGALNRSALLNSDYFLTPMASDIFSLLGILQYWRLDRKMDEFI